MKSALREYIVLGLKTNIGFLIRVMSNDEFQEGKIDTGFIEHHPDLLRPAELDTETALIAASLAMYSSDGKEEKASKRPASNWKQYARRVGVSRSPQA
jgi:pyruvate carboxylase